MDSWLASVPSHRVTVEALLCSMRSVFIAILLNHDARQSRLHPRRHALEAEIVDPIQQLCVKLRHSNYITVTDMMISCFY